MTAFTNLRKEAQKIVKDSTDFDKKSENIRDYVFDLSYDDYLNCVSEIGVIPEDVQHDSTEEKFYAKISDTILSRAFYELGLKTHVLTERGDAADVIAESIYHNYSLVGDAKVFRMSRTAKNQKDFKVSGLDTWRHDSDYAVLCSPLYQYPLRNSQVYKEALSLNVSLFSWEYLLYMLKNGVKESETINLSGVWNFSQTQSEVTSVADIKHNFLHQQESFLMDIVSKFAQDHHLTFDEILNRQIGSLRRRGEVEKQYWVNEIADIKSYTREQAISELLKTRKIDKKLVQIDKTIREAEHNFKQE